jgi:hypothetical protein
MGGCVKKNHRSEMMCAGKEGKGQSVDYIPKFTLSLSEVQHKILRKSKRSKNLRSVY